MPTIAVLWTLCGLSWLVSGYCISRFIQMRSDLRNTKQAYLKQSWKLEELESRFHHLG